MPKDEKGKKNQYKNFETNQYKNVPKEGKQKLVENRKNRFEKWNNHHI